jgi:hypothetical protein
MDQNLAIWALLVALRSNHKSKCFEICDQLIDLNGAEIAERRHLALPSGNDCSYR